MDKKSHWNYRAVKRVYQMPGGGTEEQIEIVEAYYTDGKVDGWTKNPRAVTSGEGKEGLTWVLEQMAKALERPLIIVKDIGNNETLVEEQEDW